MDQITINDSKLNLSICEYINNGQRVLIFKSDTIEQKPNSKLLLLKYTSPDPEALLHLFTNTFYDKTKIQEIFKDKNYFPRIIEELKRDPRMMFYWMENTALSDDKKSNEYWDSGLINCQIFRINPYIRYKYWLMSCPDDQYMTFQIHQFEQTDNVMTQTKIFKPFKVVVKDGILNNNINTINLPFIWNSKTPLLEDFVGHLERLLKSSITINTKLDKVLTSLHTQDINIRNIK